jgi:putative oxidoreductase
MSSNSVIGRTETPVRGKKTNRLLWILQIVVGLDFLVGGTAKLFGMQRMVDLFDHIGAGDWLRYLVAAVEIAGGIGVLIPALSGLAAMGLAALMVAATYTNVVLINEGWAPVAWLILVAIIAWGRWPQTKALFARFRH